MKAKEDLFELIQTMSSPERRHFKLNARRYSPSGAEKKYVLLFDAIYGQSHYDEPQLRQLLQHEISEKSFGSWKRHLLNYVETSIREFHAGKDSAELVHERLRDADLLHRRGLWGRARKKIEEARAIAERMGDLLTLLKINETERRLVIEFDLKGIEAKMETLLQESVAIMQKLSIEQGLAAIFEQACMLVRLKFDPRHPTVVAQVPALLADPRLQPGIAFPNARSERYYHQGRAFVFHLANLPQEEFQAYLDLLQFWRTNSYFKQAFPKLYKLSLTNYLHAAIKLGRWDDFPEVIAEIDQLPSENRDEAAEDFQTVVFYQHLYALNRYELKAALALIPAIEAGLEEFAEKVNHARWLSFRINIAVTYFMNGLFAASRRQLDMILTHPKSDQRTDAQALARLLEPVVLIDLGDEDLASYKLQALKEWLRVHKRLFEFERIIVGYLQLILSTVATDRHAIFVDFVYALQTFQAEKGAVSGLEMVLSWAKRKVGTKADDQPQEIPTVA